MTINKGREAECAAESGGQIPRKVGGKQLVSMVTSPAFLSAAGCADGRQEGFFSSSFCRFWLERHESEFIEKDRYPAKADKVFQGVDERDLCKGDYNLKMSAAMDVRRNSEVNEPLLTKRQQEGQSFT